MLKWKDLLASFLQQCITNGKNYVALILANQVYLKDDFEEGAFINANTVERDQFYALMDSLEVLQQNELTHSSETYAKANKEAVNSRYFTDGLIIIVLLTFLVGFFIAKYRRFYFTCKTWA